MLKWTHLFFYFFTFCLFCPSTQESVHGKCFCFIRSVCWVYVPGVSVSILMSSVIISQFFKAWSVGRQKRLIAKHFVLDDFMTPYLSPQVRKEKNASKNSHLHTLSTSRIPETQAVNSVPTGLSQSIQVCWNALKNLTVMITYVVCVCVCVCLHHHSTDVFSLSMELREDAVRLTDDDRRKQVGEHIPAQNKSTISL